MSELLKGNYELPKEKRAPPAKKEKDLTERFEEAALAKLGGSLCFVMKKKQFVWKGD